MRFERMYERLAPRKVFFKRVAASLGISLGLVSAALLFGVAGYHWIAQFGWVDSFLEASMILGGMGPVNQLPTDAAKVFASLYALFSGLVLIVLMGIMLTPVAHRLMHKFHVDEKDVD